ERNVEQSAEHKTICDDSNNESGNFDEEEEEFVSASDDDTENVDDERGVLVDLQLYVRVNWQTQKKYIDTPQTVTEALQGEYAQNWQESMRSEYNALLSNDT
ncbi:unnamed protein product, partial [Ceratitis capitata]